MPAGPTDPAMSPPQAAPGFDWRKLMKPLWLLLGLLVIGLALHHLHGARAGLLPAVSALQDGLRGRMLFLLAGTAICAVGLPRQTVCFAGGIAYGVGEGVALSLLATLAGATIGFLWARLAGRDWARHRLSRKADGWLSRLDRQIRAQPFITVLCIRLLPVGSALMLNLAAGVLGLRFVPFLLATLVGSLPQTLIFVLLGSGTRIGHATQIGLAAALFALSSCLGFILLKRSSLAAAQRSA
ncbi:VTT domain-containing protein [Acetobacteraceae bacterium KSS8]|uniref:TVP38/TMEM64 family membrane protein n=1 Tax=Endosaccharibacter trunci TaxID=2812733 RepID=A0ABT1WA75_9PROT|nr:VTT domain-containing protein [Acetobacteraceae bacterium KSS8]